MRKGVSTNIALTLAVIMLLGLLPLNVFAVDSQPGEIAGKTISGTVYLYANGSKNPMSGATIYAYERNADNTPGAWVGEAQSGENGRYELVVSNEESPNGYLLEAYGVPNALALTADESDIGMHSMGTWYRPVTNIETPVDISFVSLYLTAKGRVVGPDGSPVSNAFVSFGDGANTNSGGNFSAERVYVDRVGMYEWYIFSDRIGYAPYHDYLIKEITINDFKRGECAVGDITLDKLAIPEGFEKCSFTITPSMVTPNTISRATLDININAPEVQKNQIVTVEARNGAEILVRDAEGVAITKDGGKFTDFKVSSSGSKLEITMDIEPNVNYNVVFGIEAPGFPTPEKYYEAEAYIVTANGAVIIDQTIAVLSNITVTAPEEVTTNEPFTVFGEMDMDVFSQLTLTIRGDGNTYNFGPIKVTKDMGLFYKFENVNIAAPGNYTAIVEATGNSGQSVSVQTGIRAVEGSITVKQMTVKDYYDSRIVNNPILGNFLSFYAYVNDGYGTRVPKYWDMNRGLSASVVLEGDSSVQSAQFILQTNQGTYTFNATRSGSTYSANLTPFYSTGGTADLLFSITKKNGKESRFIVSKLTILVDPSGYVYDDVTTKPVQGAVATLYFKKASESAWRQWNSEDYGQMNPVKTDNLGWYGWMVPDGYVYEVRVTKEAYSNYTTIPDYGEIVVLPERTDIDVALKPVGGSSATPEKTEAQPEAKAKGQEDIQAKIQEDIKAKIQEAEPGSTVIALTLGSTKMFRNEEVIIMDAAPYSSATGRTMLPLRYVSSAFGIPNENITWNGGTSTAVIVSGDKKIEFTVGSTVMIVNGAEVEMDTATELTDERTYVSVRFLSNALGITPNWNDETKTVTFIVPTK